MNRDEAKAILRVHRPGHHEHNDPELARALEFARQDPELAQWWAKENAFDTSVAEKLSHVPPPADLRERILANPAVGSEKPSAATRQQPWWRGFSALAAALAIFATGAFFVWNHQPPAIPPPTLAEWQSGSIETLTHILAGADKLDVESPDSSKLRQWLQQVDAPSPAALPNSLTHLDTAGCKTIAIGNQRVSIICFHTGPRQLAHLVTVEERSLSNPPPEHQPQYVRHGEWVTASWSDRGQSFMLAMKGTDAELKGLLSPAA